MREVLEYDLIIVGGGMVGVSLGIALRDSGMRIALLESVPLGVERQPSYDDRAIALAYGTRRIFEGMQLWSSLAQEVTPIQRVHISDRGHFGFTHLDSRQEGVEALGYVVVSRVLGAVLMKSLNTQDHVEIFCPATVTHIITGNDNAEVTVQTPQGERRLSARLVVAADGARSQVREWLGIKTTCWEYGQTAVITNVSPERECSGFAYERFTDSGPLALLPMSEGRYSVVWTLRAQHVDEVMGLDDGDFLRALELRFGTRLGRFLRVGRRRTYPLTLIRAHEHVRPRLALIGNAAHTIHPVAGQGFNLGLRDVAVLAEIVAVANHVGNDIGDVAVLRHYATWRRRDHLKMIVFTDGLARIFANPLTPIRMARNTAMVMVDLLPPLKHVLSRHTMGMTGKLPRLARGLPLMRPL